MKLTRVIGVLSSLVAVGCAVDSATVEERPGNVSSALTSARLQIIGIAASDGRPWHGLKYPSVNTPYFNPMAPAVGDIGRISDIDATQMPNGDLQVVAAASGGLFHTVRWTGDGSWSGWGNVKAQVGDYGYFVKVAACTDGTDMSLYGVTYDGALYGAVRWQGGSWSGMWDMKANYGQIGTVVDVDCAYQEYSPTLNWKYANVLAVTSTGAVFSSFYPTSSGHFTQLAAPASVKAVDATLVSRNVHASVRTGDGTIWHAVRTLSGGSWSSFTTLTYQAGTRPDVSAGELLGELHVTDPYSASYYYWETVLRADGSTSYQAVAGNTPFISMTSAGNMPY